MLKRESIIVRFFYNIIFRLKNKGLNEKLTVTIFYLLIFVVPVLEVKKLKLFGSSFDMSYG